MSAVSNKEKIGKIHLEHFREAIRLRWSFAGKRYSLTIGRNTKETIKAARAKAALIDSDIAFGRFDSSLSKYGKASIISLEIEAAPKLSLLQLWDKFSADKSINLKPKSLVEYEGFTRLLINLGDHASFNALETKQALLAITTVERTRRVIQYLSACCNWAIKHGLLDRNPYQGLVADLPKRKSLLKPEPNAFSLEEREAVIAAFKENCSYYAPLVEFWFLTGCRPSEAIGLTWGNIAADCSSVTFSGSYQRIHGRHVWSQGSKNNKVRTVGASERLQQLLQQIKPENLSATALVFPSPAGKPTNYDSFTRRVWHKVVDPIKPGATPYNCRDTFITLQLLKGVPSAVIATWCDTSTGMIDRVYTDRLKLSQLRPID